MVDSIDLTKENIKQARLTFPSRLFRGVSEDGKDLIGKLFVGEKKYAFQHMLLVSTAKHYSCTLVCSEHLSASDCLQHPWFRENNSNLEALALDMTRIKGLLHQEMAGMNDWMTILKLCCGLCTFIVIVT